MSDPDYLAHLMNQMDPTLRGSLPAFSAQEASDSLSAVLAAGSNHDDWRGEHDPQAGWLQGSQGWQKRAFAAIAAANNPVPAAFLSNRNHRTRQPGEMGQVETDYWRNNRTVMEEFRYQKELHLHLPVKAPRTADVLIKQVILDETISAFQGAIASPVAKFTGMAHRIRDMCGEAGVTVNIHTKAMEDYASTMWHFQDLELWDEDLNPIGLDPNQADLTPQEREDTHWIVFSVSFIPRRCNFPPGNHVDASQLPTDSRRLACVPAPRVGGSMQAMITKEMITDPAHHKDLLDVYRHLGQTFTPHGRRSAGAFPDTDSFEIWKKNHIADAKFSALCMAFRQYLGDTTGVTSLRHRLGAIKMKRWDNSTKGYVYSTVEQVFQTFVDSIRSVDPTDTAADVPELAQAFYQSLTDDLKSRLAKKIPTGNDTSFNANYTRLLEMKGHAEEEESQIKSVASIARNAHRPPRTSRFGGHPGHQGGTSNTFFLQPGDTPNPSDCRVVEDGYGADITMPVCLLGTSTSSPIQGNLFTLLLTALSQAEEALKEASGSDRPNTCWGCDDPGHSFRNCPKKLDPAVLKNFQKHLQEFRQRKKDYRRSPSYYQKTGFFTRSIGEKLHTIMDEETSDTTRRTLMGSVADEIQTYLGKREVERAADTPQSKRQRVTFMALNQRPSTKEEPDRRLIREVEVTRPIKHEANDELTSTEGDALYADLPTKLPRPKDEDNAMDEDSEASEDEGMPALLGPGGPRVEPSTEEEDSSDDDSEASWESDDTPPPPLVARRNVEDDSSVEEEEEEVQGSAEARALANAILCGETEVDFCENETAQTLANTIMSGNNAGLPIDEILMRLYLPPTSPPAVRRAPPPVEVFTDSVGTIHELNTRRREGEPTIKQEETPEPRPIKQEATGTRPTEQEPANTGPRTLKEEPQELQAPTETQVPTDCQVKSETPSMEEGSEAARDAPQAQTRSTRPIKTETEGRDRYGREYTATPRAVPLLLPSDRIRHPCCSKCDPVVQFIRMMGGSENDRPHKTFMKMYKETQCRRINTPPGPLTFMFLSAAAINPHQPLEFSINRLMPHLHFPIGSGEDLGTLLKGLVDTGGCCNMGDLEYHQAIMQHYPHLVKRFIDLETLQEPPIDISGIEGGVKITHLIEYIIPFENGQGENHGLQIGLTKNLPINTLFGLPFIIKAGLTTNFGRQAVTSTVFQTEFEMTMEQPIKVPVEAVRQETGPRRTLNFSPAKEEE